MRSLVYELQGNLYFSDAEQLIRQVLDDLDDIVDVVILDGTTGGPLRCSGRHAHRRTRGRGRRRAGRTLAVADFPSLEAEGTIFEFDRTACSPMSTTALEWWEEGISTRTSPSTEPGACRSANQELLRGITGEQLAAIEHIVTTHEFPSRRAPGPRGRPVGLRLLPARRAHQCAGCRSPGATTYVVVSRAFGPGVAVGELALLDESPRSADLVADEPTRVAALFSARARRPRRRPSRNQVDDLRQPRALVVGATPPRQRAHPHPRAIADFQVRA